MKQYGMNNPGLFEGIFVALIASVGGSAIFAILTSVFAGGSFFFLIVTGLGFAYTLYLLSRSQVRVGRVIVISGWIIVAAGAWLLAPSILIYISIHLAALWLIRSLYFYSSVLSALADLGLTGFALMAAIWAWLSSGSLFLAVWCFFLVQALFVLIPRRWSTVKSSPSAALYLSDVSVREGFDQADRFETARAAAESAFKKLISHS